VTYSAASDLPGSQEDSKAKNIQARRSSPIVLLRRPLATTRLTGTPAERTTATTPPRRLAITPQSGVLALDSACV
jgi:hypothetical protein